MSGGAPEVALDRALIKPAFERQSTEIDWSKIKHVSSPDLVNVKRVLAVVSASLPPLDLSGNVAPVILGGDILGRMRKVVHEILEEGGREGDDGVISTLHCEGNADKAVADIVDKTSDIDLAAVSGGENELGHDLSFRADSDTGTITEAGGAAHAPGGGAV